MQLGTYFPSTRERAAAKGLDKTPPPRMSCLPLQHDTLRVVLKSGVGNIVRVWDPVDPGFGFVWSWEAARQKGTVLIE